MMDQALAIEQGTCPWDESVVHCNGDLDADRGYGYKQWCTDRNPSFEACLDDERYLGEDLVRPAPPEPGAVC